MADVSFVTEQNRRYVADAGEPRIVRQEIWIRQHSAEPQEKMCSMLSLH